MSERIINEENGVCIIFFIYFDPPTFLKTIFFTNNNPKLKCAVENFITRMHCVIHLSTLKITLPNEDNFFPGKYEKEA